MTEFTTTFEVRSSPAEAWKALEDLQTEAGGTPSAPRRWWLPGFESTGTEVEAEPDARLVVRKDQWPCEGTLIAVTFEHVDTGTRITVVQSGFDEAFVEASGDGFWIVCEQLAADLRLFWESGVLGGRHNRPWSPIGCLAMATPLGLEVTEVWDGTWAQRVGLVPGDTLLTLAGAPMTATRDFITVQRIFGPGDELQATWVHDGERLEAGATL